MIAGGAAGLKPETPLHSVTAALDVQSAIFRSWPVLGVKHVFLAFTLNNLPGDWGERLALPGRGLLLRRRRSSTASARLAGALQRSRAIDCATNAH